MQMKYEDNLFSTAVIINIFLYAFLVYHFKLGLAQWFIYILLFFGFIYTTNLTYNIPRKIIECIKSILKEKSRQEDIFNLLGFMQDKELRLLKRFTKENTCMLKIDYFDTYRIIESINDKIHIIDCKHFKHGGTKPAYISKQTLKTLKKYFGS
jgi:hypothetical protein